MRFLGPATASSLVNLAGAMFGVTLTNEAIILFSGACISLEFAPVDLRQELFRRFILTRRVRYPTTPLLKKATMKSIAVIWNDTILDNRIR
jgi:hypothetical protein